jgi:hypothetical protein
MNRALNILTSINGREFIGKVRRFCFPGRALPSGIRILVGSTGSLNDDNFLNVAK